MRADQENIGHRLNPTRAAAFLGPLIHVVAVPRNRPPGQRDNPDVIQTPLPQPASGGLRAQVGFAFKAGAVRVSRRLLPANPGLYL
jgi:hypothetical protein